MIGEISAKARTTHHSKALDTAVLDGCEEQPGGAVEQGKHPARDDDPPCPGHGADVLKTIVKEDGQKTCIRVGVRVSNNNDNKNDNDNDPNNKNDNDNENNNDSHNDNDNNNRNDNYDKDKNYNNGP